LGEVNILESEKQLARFVNDGNLSIFLREYGVSWEPLDGEGHPEGERRDLENAAQMAQNDIHSLQGR
jgi:hypothetical protein